MSESRPGTTLLSVPGKTFLVGEYLAIAGGPSLLLSTGPRFELRYWNSGSTRDRRQPFAPASPAGHLLARRRERQREAASPLRFDFSDPHRGKGGLGASSAQFALLYAALENWASFEPAKADWKKLLEEYRACAWNGEGSAPSGADVVSQLCGGVTWYDGREFRTRSFEWKFPTLGFTLLRTGAKLATHEHLRQSGTTSETKAALHESLRSAVLQATNSFETSNESQLVASVDQAAKALAQAGLTAERTQSLLSELRSRDGLVVAAKGCGAMGADVMLVIHERNRTREIENCARELELEICGSTDSLSQGLKIEPSVG